MRRTEAAGSHDWNGRGEREPVRPSHADGAARDVKSEGAVRVAKGLARQPDVPRAVLDQQDVHGLADLVEGRHALLSLPARAKRKVEP